FFQAEDGIRDRTVTGVQTCALPILRIGLAMECNECEDRYRRLGYYCEFCPVPRGERSFIEEPPTRAPVLPPPRRKKDDSIVLLRSEERRVGKDCRSMWRWDD